MFSKRIYIYGLPALTLAKVAQELRSWNVRIEKDGPYHIYVIGGEGAVNTAIECANEAAGKSLVVSDDHQHQLTGKDFDFGL